MPDRIAGFALAMTDPLARLAGETIHKLGKVEPKRRQVVLDGLLEILQGPACGDRQPLHDREVLASHTMVPGSCYRGNHAALRGVRLRSGIRVILGSQVGSRTITEYVASNMYEHIRTFAEDRGMNRDLYNTIDIGFEGIPLEGSHR